MLFARFFKDTIIYGIASVITGGLSIILLPYLARVLVPQEYGLMDLLLSTFAIVNIVVPFSITQSIAKFYPSVDASLRPVYASTGLWFTSIMYLLFLFFAIIFIRPIATFFIGNQTYTSVIIISFISTLFYGVFYYLLVQLRWMLKPVHYVVTNFVFVLLSCFLTIVFIRYFHMRVDAFFMARILASLLAGTLGWYFMKNEFIFVCDTKALRVMLAFSTPLVISSVGVFVSLYIDRFLIRAMLSLTDLGIYSACARVASIAGVLISVINFALTPIIYSSHEDPETRVYLALIFKMIIYTMLAIILVLLLFSKPILTEIIGEQYAQGSYVLPILVASFIIAGLYNCAPGLWIANKTKLIAIINIGSAILNTLLCLILIPYCGYMGAAIATLISSIVTLVATTNLAQKYYHISYDWMKIYFAILATLICSYLILSN